MAVVLVRLDEIGLKFIDIGPRDDIERLRKGLLDDSRPPRQTRPDLRNECWQDELFH